MMTRMCALLALLSMTVSLACNDRGNPPPQFNGPIITADGATLMPIRLAKRDKASLTGSAGSTETTAASATGSSSGSGGVAGTVTIDDSTPEALASTLVEIIKTNSLAQLVEILVPEQRESAQQLLNAVQPVLEASAELKKVLDEKFPGHAIQLSSIGSMSGGLPKEVTITDIETIDEDNAKGTVHANTPSGETKTEPINFKRVDGKWRVVATDIMKAPPPEQLEKLTDAMSKVAEAMRSTTQKVADGEITDEKTAKEELGKAAMGAVMGLMGSMGAPVPDTASEDKPAETPTEEPPAEPQADKKPAEGTDAAPGPRRRQQPSEPDPLDGTITGPTLRRR